MSPDRRRTILTLALPIIGGMTSQNIMNLVDTAMVGSLGANALAAVGIAGFANFMCISIILGLSTAVQATAARRKGEGNEAIMAGPLNGGLLLAVAIGLPLSILFYLLTPWLFPYLVDDLAVQPLGTEYLQVRLIGMIFVGMNFAFRGYWNGISMPQLYFRTLLIMNVLNICLNYVLIYGHAGVPALGVYGAGLGTTLSLATGTAIYFFLGHRHASAHSFLHALPSKNVLISMLRLSIPSSIQQFFFAAGLTALFWIIGKVGTAELAAGNVLVNIMLVALLPGIALGLTAATLAGQAMGKGNIADAKQWGWDVSKIGFYLLAVLGIPMVVVPELLLSVFIHETETMQLAIWPLRIIGLFIAFDGVGMILMNALFGVGASKAVMQVSLLMQWCVFLPLAWLIGPVWGGGLMAIWLLQVAYRAIQVGIFSHIWRKGNWQSIKV
ncbi:MATE family efflux transporter [Paraperlucidibaca sp.]|uniref:MATE family efflux transporter n=1 Tax=Paraperlucidibaca sp. TaxID=2708021 RepID=UPI0030F3777B|tara:strand:+ start:7199 stop:8521 length:1323 start_codon:yes stop_codon:yes gene_type:complete